MSDVGQIEYVIVVKAFGMPSPSEHFSNATAAAAAVAANYYDNAYLSFEKSLRGAFGGTEGMAGASLLDGPGGVGGDGGGGGGGGGGSGATLDPYGSGHHLLSPINYTLTAEAINRRIRSTLGLDEPDPMERALALNNGGKGGTDDCCPGMASPDWIMRRSAANSAGGPALADTRVYTHSPLPPGTPGTLYEDHKFAPFSPTSSNTMHDDNNNVDKKTFQEFKH
uniref:Uncharacterized protein n=1 Tax=Anopheles farauti TaxID=69004 RepID=A0A182QWT3_9DIPT